VKNFGPLYRIEEFIQKIVDGKQIGGDEEKNTSISLLFPQWEPIILPKDLNGFAERMHYFAETK
jgi:hypothetical protein